VLGAIIAFGPTFSFPIIGAMAARSGCTQLRDAGERAHRKVQLTPLAILQGSPASP